MSRIKLEKAYWNENALDPNVDEKYIADIDAELCKQDLQPLHGRVLEIGCGVGRLLEDGYVGVDISENMIEIARQRVDNELYITDGRSLPFKGRIFDFVYSYLVFQHIPSDAIMEYMFQAYGVLKEGGEFVFQFIEGNEDEPFSKHYSREDMQAMGFLFSKHVFKKSVAYDGWTIGRFTK